MKSKFYTNSITLLKFIAYCSLFKFAWLFFTTWHDFSLFNTANFTNTLDIWFHTLPSLLFWLCMFYCAKNFYIHHVMFMLFVDVFNLLFRFPVSMIMQSSLDSLNVFVAYHPNMAFNDKLYTFICGINNALYIAIILSAASAYYQWNKDRQRARLVVYK